MSTILYDFQKKLIEKIYEAWSQNHRNVLLQLPTGGGKTVIFSRILIEHVATHSGYAIVIAHRNQLVTQASLALARNRVAHDIIAAHSAIKNCMAVQRLHLNEVFYQPGASIIVAGIDTLLRCTDARFDKITLVVHDEGHHVLRNNKWGKVHQLFPNARGLLVTATPLRADNCGLGSKADGIADVLITGPTTKELITCGYLSNYKYVSVPKILDLSTVPVTNSGEYSHEKLVQAVRKSKITGDVVKHYLTYASGKLGLTFVTDLVTAAEVAQRYRSAGVAAEVISGKTPELIRAQLMRKFERRDILQLVSVDLLGEGVDVPAIEVVALLRPTNSYALYKQQVGRALRIAPNKSHAIIIDHVNNWHRHGLPGDDPVWSLAAVDKRKRTISTGLMLTTCVSCFFVHARHLKNCPFCAYTRVPVIKATSIEEVDGDLLEIEDTLLSNMQKEVDRLDRIHAPINVPGYVRPGIEKRLADRKYAQKLLRQELALWAGKHHASGLQDTEIYRLFYLTFGIDLLSAQALNYALTIKLTQELKND